MNWLGAGNPNLDLIKSLKEEVAQKKKTENMDEKEMFEIAQENKRMSEPLKEALLKVDRYRLEVTDYDKTKKTLKGVKRNLLDQEDRLKGLAWEHEVLVQRYEAVKVERDDLYNKYRSTIYEVQQKAGFKNLLLEKRLTAVGEGLERKEAQLGEILSQANLEPAAVGIGVGGGENGGKLDRQQLLRLDVSVRDLKQELERVVRAHNNAIREYEDKLTEYGIPSEEVGFRPVQEMIPGDLV